jgi:NAD(P)-dependent dehydrogenase (short-subunit alcohol dehydrogenase family)
VLSLAQGSAFICIYMTPSSITFKGQTVLVTGAAQGLGKASSLAFGLRGARVAMVDLNESVLNDSVAELRGQGIECAGIMANIAESGGPQAIVEKTVKLFGNLNILVNNAAVSSVEALLDVTESEWDKVFAVNVKALFFLLQAAARVMKTGGGGRIINVSSPGTRMTLTNYTSYATSKAAVDYITRTAAANLGPFGITVNAIAPGRMDTPMQRITEEANAAAMGVDLKTYIDSRTVDIPLRRRTTPEEVAEGIVWLATQEASYVTANRLNISGGLELD